MDDVELRELVPRVLSVLVCRGADFATAEDAVQEALIRALSAWGDELPADPTGWLITVAWRAFLDMTRSDAARRNRELRVDTEPPAGAGVLRSVRPSVHDGAAFSAAHIL